MHRFDALIAGPAAGETILVAQGSMEVVFAAKAGYDVTGHDARPDIFQLLVHDRPVIPEAEPDRRETSASSAPGSDMEPDFATILQTVKDRPEVQEAAGEET